MLSPFSVSHRICSMTPAGMDGIAWLGNESDVALPFFMRALLGKSWIAINDL